MKFNEEELLELRMIVIQKINLLNTKIDKMYFKKIENSNDEYIEKRYDSFVEKRDLFSNLYKKLLNYKGE